MIDQSENNPKNKCIGCPNFNLPRSCIIDYEFENQCDILFVSDSLKLFEGDYVPFRSMEYTVILNELKRYDIDLKKVGFTSSMKCPNLTADTAHKDAKKLCRNHLEDTINHYKPKLVFACGSLATEMFYGKKVKGQKTRGVIKEFELKNGFKFQLTSIIHPFQVVSEPKNQFLFSTDVENAINRVIKKEVKIIKVDHTPILSVEDLKPFDYLTSTKNTLAIDIETTGLNFLEDTIHTVSISELCGDTGDVLTTIVLPIDHREANLTYKVKADFVRFLQCVCCNKNNIKVFHNASFDTKFLHRYGVTIIENTWCSKLLYHLYDEENPKRLLDLMIYFFPKEQAKFN